MGNKSTEIVKILIASSHHIIMRIMDYSRIVSKIAVDKDSITLGKIIRIDELLGKTIKKYKPYAMILVKKRFKKGVVVPIDVEKIVKVGGQYTRFDISKEEFDEQVKTAKTIQTVRETYTGDTGVHRVKGVMGWAFDPTRLSRKGKERKK
ncbi:MAG: hypothetical protein KAJ76_08005 [Candidatus Heimdallarchaeota archaeon]|nr:hypothetical protein [Candidatus Heimdallarchaeota archaeon]MCK5298834.1 hypothetical protein [Candidatus Heimdallarchaeota archaeon]